MKAEQFSPKPPHIVEGKTYIGILKSTMNLQRSRETCCDMERRLFCLIIILFTTNLLFYITLYGGGHLSPRICQRCPLAYPCNFYCCQQRNLNLLERNRLLCSRDPNMPITHPDITHSLIT